MDTIHRHDITNGADQSKTEGTTIDEKPLTLPDFKPSIRPRAP